MSIIGIICAVLFMLLHNFMRVVFFGKPPIFTLKRFAKIFLVVTLVCFVFSKFITTQFWLVPYILTHLGK